MKVCFFDIDGTLILSGSAGRVAFEATFQEAFGVEHLVKNVPFAGRSDRGITADLFVQHGIDATDENWQKFHDCYVEQIATHVKRCEGCVLPGVLALIERLQAMPDVHLGLLTGNVVAGAEAKLRHYGLWHHFAFGGFGDLHPERNDIAASALAEARKHHAASPSQNERVVVIGDTPNDIRCARSIGAFAVGVPTGHTSAAEIQSAKPDLLVNTLEEADEIVAYLSA